jgi:hypothetical protein
MGAHAREAARSDELYGVEVGPVRKLLALATGY